MPHEAALVRRQPRVDEVVVPHREHALLHVGPIKKHHPEPLLLPLHGAGTARVLVLVTEGLHHLHVHHLHDRLHLALPNELALADLPYCALRQIDNANKFYMWNVNNVSHPEAFNGRVRGLLTGLVEEAYTVPKLFATGEMGLEDKTKLYGLVQCTRDLSATECKECLKGAIDELPSCCDGKEGGRVVGGSCNFVYEIYPFVNV
ncbi:cysteine-rich repeat secretory protein 38 [Eucalyptus grandis]|uniref:cysteine-rich repeat secretory protein 38 n=1 Tax=Eucalyptus grandis TaxID=71139 RepID=UPI00192E7CF8|nr:cysteine-rich repeat secretory protein 38 [Eucalyptus grandis]